MKQKANWTKRYELAISEKLTTKDIMQLVDCSQPKATEIRNKAIAYCGANHIEIYSRSVPTDVVLKVINKEIKYFYEKKLLEECKFVFA